MTFTQRVTEFLTHWRVPLLLFALVVAFIAVRPAGTLDFDRSIENMFAPDDPLLVPYRKVKRTFGGNEIVMAAYIDADLFADEGQAIERLAGISRRLQSVSGVKAVLSFDQLVRLANNDPVLLARAKRLFEGYTHGADGQTVSVVCMLVPSAESDVSRRETIDRLRDVMRPLPSGTVAGEPAMVADGFRYVEQDGRRLGWATTLLLAVTIIVCFRSLRWMIVPIVVVQWSLLVTRAGMVLSGLELSMVSSMLTAVVTVVGVASVIHITVRFREARDKGLTPRQALLHTGTLLAAPLFWALTTDAAGFSSLLVARVGTIQDFGLMMALGVLTVVVSIALLVPGLVLLGRFDPDPKRAWGESFLDASLDRLIRWSLARPKTLALATLVLVGIAAAGVSRLEIETDFTRNFRAETPIVRSYEFVETNLGGAGVWDVVLPGPENPDWDYLKRLLHLEYRLRHEVTVPGHNGTSTPALTKVISLADCIVAVSKQKFSNVRLKSVRNVKIGIVREKITEELPEFVDALHGEDPQTPGRYYFRIMLRARERQPADQKRHIIEKVRRICNEEFPPPTSDSDEENDVEENVAEVGGFFVLFTHLIGSILRDQWITFGVAIVSIGLMMLIAFRSLSLALVALVPNILPILVVTGLMGWFGLRINMGAAMIAAVSIGLSIDSSIHYITAFRRHRAEGLSLFDALDRVQQSVGRAVVFSTLALIVGFLVLCTSQFVPTIYFGVLVCLTMLGGLIGNLIVLPVLLSLVTRED